MRNSIMKIGLLVVCAASFTMLSADIPDEQCGDCPPVVGCVNRPSENNGKCIESTSHGTTTYTCANADSGFDCVKGG